MVAGSPPSQPVVASLSAAKRSLMPGWAGRGCGQESTGAGSPPSQPVVASLSAANRSLMRGWPTAS